jgi:tetratricopeptide (TPR) repeat protein
MKTFSVILTLFLPFHLNFAQLQDKEMFREAESYFLFEEYNEAIGLYTRLLQKYPDNDNLNYKIGVCLLNNPFKKDKSIPYLKNAVQNISDDYKENNFKEKQAPPEAWFQLGNAYRVNNQLDRAINAYESFLEIADEETYDIQEVEEHIESCKYAMQAGYNEVYADPVKSDFIFNDRFDQIHPVISGDGQKLAYVSKLQFYDALFYSEKKDGDWLPPRNLMPELVIDGDAYPTSLSYNGKRMYIYRSDNYNGNLYVAELINGKWQNLQPLNENINTEYWESHATESKDGQTLYFTSNKDGGAGNLDIYVSKRQENGNWGPAQNLGSTINSDLNEECPFISEDGKRIFFSSYGHKNMGGYDIFYSDKVDGKWQQPVNAGKSINTTDDDLFLSPYDNGKYALIPLYRKNSQGGFDIYHFEIFSDKHPRSFSVIPNFTLTDHAPDSIKLNIQILNLQNDSIFHKEVNAANPDGEIFNLKQGRYKISINGEHIQPVTKEIYLPVYAEKSEEQLDFDIKYTSKIKEPQLASVISVPEIERTKPKEETEQKEPEFHFFLENKKFISLPGDSLLELDFLVNKGSKVTIIQIDKHNKQYYDTSYTSKKEQQQVELKLVPGVNQIKLRVQFNNQSDEKIITVNVEEKKDIQEKQHIEPLTTAEDSQQEKETKEKPGVLSWKTIVPMAVFLFIVLFAYRRRKRKNQTD